MAREKLKTRMEGQVQIREKLLVFQRREIQAMVQEFKDIFCKEPGWVRDTCHTRETPPRAIVWEKW